VYYDPKNPKESQTKKSGFSIGAVIGYIIVLLFALMLLFNGIYGIVDTFLKIR
jgi:hypothetical protein